MVDLIDSCTLTDQYLYRLEYPMPTILYAEDNPENREMMQKIFEDEDIILLEAIDGQHTLEMIRDHSPDLLLLDLFMPRLDGFGVMKALRSNPKTTHIPVIILSAWPTGDNRKRAEKAGAVDFVAKPYDPVQLIQLVNKHLAAQRIP